MKLLRDIIELTQGMAVPIQRLRILTFKQMLKVVTVTIQVTTTHLEESIRAARWIQIITRKIFVQKDHKPIKLIHLLVACAALPTMNL